MLVVVAPDKFRGTLTASQAASALAAGWRRGVPGDSVEEVPVADGGEGSLDALMSALGGRVLTASVTAPLGDPVDAAYGIAATERGPVAVVEMARASGLALVDGTRRDPRRATTRGTGELIRATCAAGARRVIVCVGGSATTDAGAGAAQAVGVRLLDHDGGELPTGGGSLRRLATIDLAGLDPAVRDADVIVAADVESPLLGAGGAAATYGPQKGASPSDVRDLEEALAHFAAVVHRDLAIDVRDLPGGGAGGGLAAGLAALLGARVRSGFDVVADAVGLAERLDRADVAVTGEGRWDPQSARGKAPAGVLRLAGEGRCATVLVAGEVVAGAASSADLVYSLVDRVGRDAALGRASEALADAAEDAARRISRGG